jgi:putative transposase
MQTFISKLSNPNNMVDKEKSTMCLTFKVCVPHNLFSILDGLYKESFIVVDQMLKDRTKTSSKYYNTIPCVLSKSLISKYQKNKKLKNITNLVLPICGDKGKQVKTVEGGLRIPAIFKKEVIPVSFPKSINGFVRQVEFFKRNKKWYMSYSYNVNILPEYQVKSYLGVDRNSVGNIATVADVSSGKVLKLGCDTAGLAKNFRNRRANLQKKGAKNALVKIKHKQERRIKDCNHKVSRNIVDYAKLHCSAIVLEDLGKISKKGKAKKYVQKSQWSFYQLESFIKYKATLLGVPVLYISPRYTSRICSKCGSLNIANGKHYLCSSCGHFEHRDVNASFNISAMACFLYGKTEVDRGATVGRIGNPLNQRLVKASQLESSGGAR